VQLETRLREINTKREKDTRKLLTKLPFKIQKVFRFVIGAYAVMAERREATRPTFIAETWFYRKIILEVMRRLNKQGIVRIEDLPYIDFNEFRDYVSGRKSAEEAFSGELIGKNRNKHLVNQRLQEPPLAIIGGYVPRWDNVKLSESIEQNSLIKGLGASPGFIIARARVITDLATQAEHFKQGEILVTRFTEASWTPLFLLAAGVVADIGSLLSHSSIVAREFGIPAIVNARNATQIINTGDLIYLDGDKGEIRIGERAV
jgi:pyruvate,water dikinase